MQRLTPEARRDIADLLSGEATVAIIAERRGIKAKSVLERCRRFEQQAGRPMGWPWRKRGHRGRKVGQTAKSSVKVAA